MSQLDGHERRSSLQFHKGLREGTVDETRARAAAPFAIEAAVLADSNRFARKNTSQRNLSATSPGLRAFYPRAAPSRGPKCPALLPIFQRFYWRRDT